jgi:hypothetical protein
VATATDAAAAQATLGALVVLGGLTSALTPSMSVPQAPPVIASTGSARSTGHAAATTPTPTDGAPDAGTPGAPALPATPDIELPAPPATPLPDLTAVTPQEPTTTVVTPDAGAVEAVTDVVAPVLDVPLP